MARITKEVIARAVGSWRRALEGDPERFAPLEVLVESYPEDYDPEERDA